MIPEGITRSRAFRFNVARLPATPTRPSRGPWLAIGLCCPDRSSLTTASSEPLNPSPPLMNSRRRLLHPRKRLGAGMQRVPNLRPWTVLTCRLPYPGGPKGASGCFFPFGVSLHLVVTGSATTLDVSRLQSSLRADFASCYGPRTASPPFEDVYIRACTNPGHPESASNMTTWVNSQFPRPDFLRQVQRHYGLQNDSRPLFPSP